MNKIFTAMMSLCMMMCVVLHAQTPPAVEIEKIYVGILDDAREEMVDWRPGVAQQRLIRPAFVKTRAGWHTVNPATLPDHMKWTVVFDGKTLGQVTSESTPVANRPEEKTRKYLTAVQILVTPAAVVPVVGVPSKDFDGLSALGGTKSRRPLVVVSAPNVGDPDSWKRLVQAPDWVVLKVRAAFRHDFPRVDRCKDEEIIKHNWNYPDTALTLPVTYASNKNSFLVEARLNAGDCGYVDDSNDPNSEPWFYVARMALFVGSALL